MKLSAINPVQMGVNQNSGTMLEKEMRVKATADHATIQRIIIVSLGVMTYIALLTSCSYSSPCSAYDDVKRVEAHTAKAGKLQR